MDMAQLLALSSKLIVPSLQKLCSHFLLTHASGRPVMALMLAEQHANGELYREASRFVLDQRECSLRAGHRGSCIDGVLAVATWDQEEMNCLSEQTQLKLSKRYVSHFNPSAPLHNAFLIRRNWFLERLLKLGSIDVKKEYTCVSILPCPVTSPTSPFPAPPRSSLSRVSMLSLLFLPYLLFLFLLSYPSILLKLMAETSEMTAQTQLVVKPSSVRNGDKPTSR